MKYVNISMDQHYYVTPVGLLKHICFISNKVDTHIVCSGPMISFNFVDNTVSIENWHQPLKMIGVFVCDKITLDTNSELPIHADVLKSRIQQRFYRS